MVGTQQTETSPPVARAEATGSDTLDLPAISVVVIGRNEGDRLARCLESVRCAEYPADRIELIYVDSNSSDDSCAIAERFGADVIRISTPPFAAARGRNLGWRRARHGLVHFLDGDVVLNSGWLRKAVARLKDPTIGCVFGRREEIRPDASIYMRVCAFDWHVPSGPWRLCGGDALFRREILERIGGFTEDLIAGEEPELSYRLRRLGWLIWRLDEPMTQHDLNMTRFSQYWKRLVRSGWAYCVVAARCRRGPERFWIKENAVNAAELAVWIGLAVAAAASGTWWAWPILAALLAGRVAWIAASVRCRAENWWSAVLYAVHCLFGRIPFFVGQIRGLWFLITQRPAKLIEYNPHSSG